MLAAVPQEGGAGPSGLVRNEERDPSVTPTASPAEVAP